MSTGAPEAPPVADATRGLTRKIVIALLLGALIYAALALYGDVRELRATAQRFSANAFALALALAAGNYVLRIVRWHYYLLRIGVRVPLGESALVFLAGFVMSVTPGKIGEVIKSLLLYEVHGTPIARTAPIVIAERLTDLVALVLLTTLGVALSRRARLLRSPGSGDRIIARLYLGLSRSRGRRRRRRVAASTCAEKERGGDSWYE